MAITGQVGTPALRKGWGFSDPVSTPSDGGELELQCFPVFADIESGITLLNWERHLVQPKWLTDLTFKSNRNRNRNRNSYGENQFITAVLRYD
jgi:hypothetical protein